MKFHIETRSHKPLKFLNELPQKFQGPLLPGGEVLSTSDDFGELCMQEFDGGNFIIRYSCLQTNEPFQIDAVNHFPGVHVVIMMRNEIQPVFTGLPALSISEGQFTILIERELSVKIDFPAKQQFICFEAMLSHSLAESIFIDFPELPFSLSSELSEIWVNPATWIDEETRDHIRYIFTYTNPEKWRRNYFENRVWDIAWKLVSLHLSADPSRLDLRQSDREKVYTIQRRIVDNLEEHTIIRDLAQEVLTNESHLKNIFSKVYGMGIHEYRIYERLKKAIHLIKEGMTVKEAARQTGWQSADLIKAYSKVYGTTPGTIKKKGK